MGVRALRGPRTSMSIDPVVALEFMIGGCMVVMLLVGWRRLRRPPTSYRSDTPQNAEEVPIFAVCEKQTEAAELAHGVHRLFEPQAARHSTFKTATGTHHVACRRGCAFCCSYHVGISVSEALLIVAYIRGLARVQREQLTRRVADAYPEVRGIDVGARMAMRIECPLLGADRSCQIYTVRPLACRAWASFDAKACEEDAANPRAQTEILRPAGLEEARDLNMPLIFEREAELGFVPGLFELIQAVHLLLQSEEITERVANGEGLLAAAWIRF